MFAAVKANKNEKPKQTPAAQLKLFNNVADLLKAVRISLLLTLIVRDHLRSKDKM